MFCANFVKLALWFWRSRTREKFTHGQTDKTDRRASRQTDDGCLDEQTDDGRKAIKKAHKRKITLTWNVPLLLFFTYEIILMTFIYSYLSSAIEYDSNKA